MGLFNYLLLKLTCPRCGSEAEMEAEFRFGLRELLNYRIGDRLRWDGNGVKTPPTRPEAGNYAGEAYVVCPLCQRDFWLAVSVIEDIIASATVDTTKQPYIPDDFQPPEPDKTPETPGKWDPVAYAEQMRRSTADVSAFFMIDSLDAIPKCIQWLKFLEPYHLPGMEDSQYFKDVREIYQAGKRVMNFDYDSRLLWQDQDYPGKLRCHFFARERYEIELWLPGVIANELADQFTDGHEGFFCAFMPPAFYD